MKLVLASSLLLSGAALLGCSSTEEVEPVSQPHFDAVFEPGACPIAVPAGGVEGENVSCGTVKVPVRWGDPGGPTIDLAVVKISADAAAPAPAPDPLVMLTGGAGASAILSFLDTMLSPAGAPIRASRDVVLFDQRGTGESRPSLGCPEYIDAGNADIGADVPPEAAFVRDAAAMRACHDRLAGEGIDLDAFNSVENAADVPGVMRALGYATYSVYGLSYGTLRAQHLLRDAPEGIRAVMLDSVAPLEAPIFEQAPRHAQEALEGVFARCAADAACAAAYPDIQGTFLSVMADLDANPVTLDAVSPLDGQPVSIVFRGRSLLEMLLSGLTPEAVPYLPYVVDQAAHGDFSIVTEYYPSLIVRGASFADGMETSFRCTEAADFEVDDIDVAGLWPQTDELVAGLVRHILAVCEEDWPAELIDASKRSRVTSEVPALLMVGEFDQTTPPAFADMAHANLSRSRVYRFPGTGHVAFGECSLAMMGSFLEDPAREPDHTCLDEMSVSFIVP